MIEIVILQGEKIEKGVGEMIVINEMIVMGTKIGMVEETTVILPIQLVAGDQLEVDQLLHLYVFRIFYNLFSVTYLSNIFIIGARRWQF